MYLQCVSPAIGDCTMMKSNIASRYRRALRRSSQWRPRLATNPLQNGYHCLVDRRKYWLLYVILNLHELKSFVKASLKGDMARCQAHCLVLTNDIIPHWQDHKWKLFPLSHDFFFFVNLWGKILHSALALRAEGFDFRGAICSIE